ncbi:MAG: hypothetical protein ABJB74_00935 [Gemmatimonas sp.]
MGGLRVDEELAEPAFGVILGNSLASMLELAFFKSPAPDKFV